MTRATSAGQNEPSVAGVSGPRALIMAITCAGPGRWAGSFFRQASMTWRSRGGIALRSGSAETIRNRTDAGLSPPNGGLPVAAYASTQPREKMSLAGPAGPVLRLLGRHVAGGADHHARRRSAACRWNGREMPKSITCGPSSASSTLAGLRSRWIRPGGVHRAQRLGEPGGEPPDRRLGQRPVLGDDRGERRPRHVRRGQPGRAVGDAGVDDGRGVHAADRAGGRHLVAEPPQELRVARRTAGG